MPKIDLFSSVLVARIAMFVILVFANVASLAGDDRGNQARQTLRSAGLT